MSNMLFEYTLKNKIDIDNFDLSKILKYYHDQDCCENVYIDFSSIKKDMKTIRDIFYGAVVTGFSVSSIENMGISVRLYMFREYAGECDFGIFLPCRNEQNGYYSSNLDLIIKIEGEKFVIDLEEAGVIQDIII